MIKKLMLFTFLFGGNILNASTELGTSALEKQIGQNFGQIAKSFAKATGSTVSLQYFFNFILGNSPIPLVTTIIKSFEKIVLKTIRGTSITSYATAYNETIQEISKEVFESYNPGSTGKLNYSKPFREFLAYSRELNSKNHHIKISTLIKYLERVCKNTKKDIYNLYSKLIKMLIQNQQYTENSTNNRTSQKQEDDISQQVMYDDISFSVLMLYIDNVIDNLHKQICHDTRILALLRKNETESKPKQTTEPTPEQIVYVNQLFDKIKLWETICILKLNDTKQTDTEYLGKFIETVQNIMKNITCFNTAYQNTILKIDSQKLADYILKYKFYRETVNKYSSQELNIKQLDAYITLIRELMTSITRSIEKTGKTEIIDKINKFGTSDYLNTFFDKNLNKLTIEHKANRAIFMKYFEYYAGNYCKKIYKKLGKKINLKYFCWKVEEYITSKNQRKYVNDSTWKKILHPFTEKRKQINTSMEDIYYSKGFMSDVINFAYNKHSWITSYITLGVPILNVLSCISIELISDWLLEFYNRRFIVNDIKEIYTHMAIDKSLVPYISYVLSKINSEIRTEDYKKCFDYITKSNYYFDHTKSDHIGTIIQIYISYISSNMATNYDLNILSQNFIKLLDEKIMNDKDIFEDIFNDNISSKLVYKPKSWEKFAENYRNDQKTRECTKKYFAKLLPMVNELVQFFYCSEFIQQYIKQCYSKEIIKQRIGILKQSINKTEQAVLDFLKFFAIQYDINLNDISSLNEAKEIFFTKIKENTIINIGEIKFLFINSIETMINLTKYQIQNMRNEKNNKQKMKDFQDKIYKGTRYLGKFIDIIKNPENETQDNSNITQNKTIHKKIINGLKSTGIKIIDYFSGNNEYYTNFIKIFFYDIETLKNIIKKEDIYKSIIK